MLSKYSDFILRWRFLVVLISLVCVFLFAAGGKNLVFTNDYRYFFSEDNPQLLEFETLQDTYTKNDNVFIMLEPKDGNVFNKSFLTALKELTENSWQVPHSIRVDSITNFQHTYAQGDDLIVIDLVDNVESLSSKDLTYIQNVALNEPLLVHRLVSASSEAAAVNITIELPGKNEIIEGPEVVNFTRDMVMNFEQSHPEINVYSTGIVMMNNAFPEASINDMKSLIPLAFVAIIIGLFLFLRSISATISALVVIIFSIMMGMGAAGWLGFKLTPPSASAPIMILTLAVADCVHFLTTFLHSMRNGLDKFAAIKESLRINFNPIFLTSLTTAIGFLSLNFSDVPPFHDLGNITAMGVTFAFILSVFFLPALTAVLPFKVKQGVDRKTKLMQNIAKVVILKRKALLWGMGAVILAFLAIIPRNEINDRFVEYFDDSIEFRRHTDYVTEKISGLYSVQFSLEAESSGGISEPAFLQKMDSFVEWLRHQPEVMHVNAVSDTFKRLNKNMHSDDGSFYKLPGSRELAAQYLLLYELSLPYGLDLNDQINIDKSSTRISTTLATLSTDQMLGFEQRARDWIIGNASDMKMIASSPAVIFSHLAVRNIDSMIIGTLVALALISIILIFALKSFKLGLISLIPNLTPIGVAFGIWAIFDSEIGLALSIVAGMTLGIVVDDTVHFMSKYLRAKREKNLSATEAVRYAFENVGTALLITTIVLAAGFLVLSMSAFELNSAMGLLTAIAADKRDTGFESQTAEMVMTLRNRQGQESTRYIRTRTLEVEGDGDKTLSIFDRPADVKHTAVLTYSHGLEPDDQWLYLPALKRVKRINSRNKSGPFVGSEFAFEDLGSQEVEKYSYKHLRDESCGEWECHVIERYPEYEYSGYTRQIGWIDKAEYRVVKIEFYDRKDAQLKTLSYSGYQEYEGRFWRPDEMFMVNHQTGKETTLKWSNYELKTDVPERDFNSNALPRLR